MDFISVVVAFLVAYLFGSIPFGLIVGKKCCKIDVRQHGSGNIGATNCFRVLGKKWGGIVFFLDSTKGIIGIVVAKILSQEVASEILPLFFGITAILGHTLPIWLKFKGGKGVATSLGVFVYLLPLPTLATFLIWILVFLCFRIISLASVVAALVFPLLILLTQRSEELFGAFFLTSLGLSCFILFTHRQNLARLIRGEEKKII
jgi:glycerol-3-phosphate acyltransferase PlsY